MGNGVPFFLGELVVRLHVNPFPGRIRLIEACQLSHFWTRSLHLLIECASPNIDFNLTYLGVTALAKQGPRHPKRRLNQR
jgi:hypothetical protein